MIMNRSGPESANAQFTADAGLVPQLAMMIQALWASAVRDRLLLLSGALFSVIVATAYGQIRLNNWNQPFYDALSRRGCIQLPTRSCTSPSRISTLAISANQRCATFSTSSEPAMMPNTPS